MTIELSLFLAEWIREHIIKVDRLLGEYVKALPATGRPSRVRRAAGNVRQSRPRPAPR